MVIVYRPYVSRWLRAWNVIKAKPRFWLKHYPEHSAMICILISTGVISIGSKLIILGRPEGRPLFEYIDKPYYRSFYEVVRPDDQWALEWRLPEEYPAHFVTNRQSDNQPSKSYKKHYAWDVK